MAIFLEMLGMIWNITNLKLQQYLPEDDEYIYIGLVSHIFIVKNSSHFPIDTYMHGKNRALAVQLFVPNQQSWRGT